ncbi:MAG: DoxX family protein [Alphaproteobacteria bacterium HGW-Alphaproteobacteria-17]|nr:MAG: DoxX family protein [Alphaproteobacteria bacterium HGW-Alphaproteobacteria-17]
MQRQGRQKMMAYLGPKAPATRAAQVLEILRITVAILILIHGVYRLAAGLVVPFGTWLDSIGFPFGYGWAMAVTLYELVGPALMLARRWTSLAALGHAAILTLGMVLVHLPAGWFVVGGGRNGMEYSVLLIVSLLAIAWAHWPERRPTD